MKWLLLLVTIFLLLLTLLLILSVAYNNTYRWQFFPGVTINNQSMAKQNVGQAIAILQQQTDDFLQKGINYQYQNDTITIYPLLPISSDSDIAQRLIDFQITETADTAFRIGHHQNYLSSLLEQFEAKIFGVNVPLQYEFYEEKYLDILRSYLAKYVTPGVSARPKIDENLNVTILPELTGINFNYQIIINETLNRIDNLSSEPIIINLTTENPAIKQADIGELIIKKVNDIVATATPIILSHGKQNWLIKNQTFKDWVIFKNLDDKIGLGFEASATLAYLNKEVAPTINLPTLDAKFNVINGKVAEFQGSQDGQELDLEKSLAIIEEEVFQNNNYSVALAVNETKAKVATSKVNDLGIAEIIGTGHSNFAGSPKNRRYNIDVGARTLNGILIRPNEEFSLTKTLGKISAESGYKPELVIKGDRTIPEYGGGLCQIGTTVFRAALASGLPITERHPHSYRVAYYEPAGKDATIYDPRPDLKFINDSENYILIQTRIVGDDLYFDFWGTKDGRIIQQSDSVIYNIKSPGQTQYIETDALAPGQENCIEKAHNGADAYFDYKVTYQNGEIKEERFSSHYVPWPKKCLIGKTIIASPDMPTSTETIINP